MTTDIAACANSKDCSAKKTCKRALVLNIQMHFPRWFLNGQPELGSDCPEYYQIEQQTIDFNADGYGVFV